MLEKTTTASTINATTTHCSDIERNGTEWSGRQEAGDRTTFATTCKYANRCADNFQPNQICNFSWESRMASSEYPLSHLLTRQTMAISFPGHSHEFLLIYLIYFGRVPLRNRQWQQWPGRCYKQLRKSYCNPRVLSPRILRVLRLLAVIRTLEQALSRLGLLTFTSASLRGWSFATTTPVCCSVPLARIFCPMCD